MSKSSTVIIGKEIFLLDRFFSRKWSVIFGSILFARKFSRFPLRWCYRLLDLFSLVFVRVKDYFRFSFRRATGFQWGFFVILFRKAERISKFGKFLQVILQLRLDWNLLNTVCSICMGLCFLFLIRVSRRDEFHGRFFS